MGAAPIWFNCPVARRNRVWTGNYEIVRGQRRRVELIPRRGHAITRTGRTKPNPSHRGRSRTLDQSHEYRCECGHVGWSAHMDMLHKPVAEP